MNKKSPLYVLAFMIIITALCGAAISFVQYSMRDTLEANARLARNRTILRAFNLISDQTPAATYDRLLSGNLITDTVGNAQHKWERFTRKSGPPSIGFIFKGMGFWDIITGILVLTPDMSEILAFDIIEQKETPGLGARIEETAFKKQFAGYRLNWNSDKPFFFGESPDGAHKKVDAITGATQTSMALERIINNELTAFRNATMNSARPSSGGK